MTSCFGGVLRRVAAGRWEWIDGSQAPVRDWPPSSEYNLRCCRYGNGATFVEVPCDLAGRDECLSWVLRGFRAGQYLSRPGGGRPGAEPMILVPIEEWDAWSQDHPVGCVWASADEPAILAKARELGWSG